ncbi:hypothetical protein [Burkholderia sp. LMG 32019]|uniref:hypothetical protein n=1 Tax=Burkholderia sp. LMG 32019 TaxID=3158173 RepID=UPI003C2F4804
MKILPLYRMSIIASLAALHVTAHAADLGTKAFDAALCKPAYSVNSATALYNEAEKVAKADMLSGAATYTLPQAVERDGFTARQLVVAGTAIGVLIEGERADALAAKYQLVKEDANLLSGYKVNNRYAAYNRYTKGYAREMAVNGISKVSIYGNPGTVLIAARESQAFPGKTLLTCEFISDFDRDQAKAASH